MIKKYVVTLNTIQVELYWNSTMSEEEKRLQAKHFFSEILIDPDRDQEVSISIKGRENEK